MLFNDPSSTSSSSSALCWNPRTANRVPSSRTTLVPLARSFTSSGLPPRYSMPLNEDPNGPISVQLDRAHYNLGSKVCGLVTFPAATTESDFQLRVQVIHVITVSTLKPDHDNFKLASLVSQYQNLKGGKPCRECTNDEAATIVHVEERIKGSVYIVNRNVKILSDTKIPFMKERYLRDDFSVCVPFHFRLNTTSQSNIGVSAQGTSVSQNTKISTLPPSFYLITYSPFSYELLEMSIRYRYRLYPTVSTAPSFSTSIASNEWYEFLVLPGPMPILPPCRHYSVSDVGANRGGASNHSSLRTRPRCASENKLQQHLLSESLLRHFSQISKAPTSEMAVVHNFTYVWRPFLKRTVRYPTYDITLTLDRLDVDVRSDISLRVQLASQDWRPIGQEVNYISVTLIRRIRYLNIYGYLTTLKCPLISTKQKLDTINSPLQTCISLRIQEDFFYTSSTLCCSKCSDSTSNVLQRGSVIILYELEVKLSSSFFWRRSSKKVKIPIWISSSPEGEICQEYLECINSLPPIYRR